MRKTTILLVALAGLALASPLADAQMQMTVALALDPPTQRLTQDKATTTTGVVTITADATAPVTNLNGITIQYTVAKAPAWLSVVVSPASDVVTFPLAPGVSQSVSKSFVVTMDVDPSMTDEAVDTVEVVALVIPNAPGATMRSAKASVPVHVEGSEPCDEHGKGHAAAPAATAASAGPTDAPGLDAAAPAADAPAPVTIQQASTPIAPISYVAIGGFAVAGAGAGFLLRRRL